MTSETEEAVRDDETSVTANFYRDALNKAERIQLPKAEQIEGIDDEIAMLRVKLHSVVSKRKENIPLMLRGIDLLVKAVSARYRLSKQAEEDLSDSLDGLIRGVGGTLAPGRFEDA